MCAEGVLLDPLLSPYHYSDKIVGLYGGFLLLMGLIGSIIIGKKLTKTNVSIFKYIKIISVCSILALIIIFISFEFSSVIGTGAAVGLYGFFTISYLPISLEIAADLTFPIAEAAVSGIMITLT